MLVRCLCRRQFSIQRVSCWLESLLSIMSVICYLNFSFRAASSNYSNPNDVPTATPDSQYSEVAGLFVNDLSALQ